MKNDYLFLEGKLTFLRPFLKSDIRAEYLEWLNNPKMTIYSSTFRTFPTTELDIDVFYNHLKTNNQVIFAACCKNTNKHFGNVSVNNIDWINRRCDHGVMIGLEEFRGAHYLDIMDLLCQYAFMKLNLNKIYGATEIPSVPPLLERIGWTQEGLLKKHNFRNGQYVDVYQMGLLKETYTQITKGEN